MMLIARSVDFVSFLLLFGPVRRKREVEAWTAQAPAMSDFSDELPASSGRRNVPLRSQDDRHTSNNRSRISCSWHKQQQLKKPLHSQAFGMRLASPDEEK
jgi:hypothetical protein